MKSQRAYLRDLLDYLQRVQDFTAAGKEAFLTDEKTQFAVIRAYEVIGEIVKRLPLDFRDNYPQVDWKRLTGFRDFLAHNYEELILEFVWDAVEDVPNLRTAVEAMLLDLPNDEDNKHGD
jgi:uncharacterized protein with HEPN domain